MINHGRRQQNQNRTGSDHGSDQGADHGSDHRKKSFKEKNPKNQISYKILINKNKSGKLKYVK